MTKYDRRPRWRDQVLGSSKLRPLTKLVLVVTAEYMRADGKVCVQRSTIAERLGLTHMQRVTDAWAQACEHEYMTLLHKGAHGRPSTYQAIVPDPSVVTADPVTISDRSTRSLERPQIRSLEEALSDRRSGHLLKTGNQPHPRSAPGLTNPQSPGIEEAVGQ